MDAKTLERAINDLKTYPRSDLNSLCLFYKINRALPQKIIIEQIATAIWKNKMQGQLQGQLQDRQNKFNNIKELITSRTAQLIKQLEDDLREAENNTSDQVLLAKIDKNLFNLEKIKNCMIIPLTVNQPIKTTTRAINDPLINTRPQQPTIQQPTIQQPTIQQPTQPTIQQPTIQQPTQPTKIPSALKPFFEESDAQDSLFGEESKLFASKPKKASLFDADDTEVRVTKRTADVQYQDKQDCTTDVDCNEEYLEELNSVFPKQKVICVTRKGKNSCALTPINSEFVKTLKDSIKK
jgi:hypothetical protein